MEDDPIHSKIEIRPSAISGQGTFAIEKISRGEHIKTLSGIYQKNQPNEVTTIDPLQIGESLFLILDYQSKTINHSCDPNACLIKVSELYALRDIEEGEEITYDYSTTCSMHDFNMNMQCNCGTKHCRKIIRNVLTIPRQTLLKYIQQKMLQDFVLRELEEVSELV